MKKYALLLIVTTIMVSCNKDGENIFPEDDNIPQENSLVSKIYDGNNEVILTF